MGRFKLDMRAADYERRDPRRGNAASWLALLVAGAIVIGTTTMLVPGYNTTEWVQYLLDSVRTER